jgi:protoporphyrinogen oxidase
VTRRAIIIGGGPAGLTAAYELLTRTDIKPIVLEKSSSMGGLSRTINYKGNRMDIGGHRFFSKSDRVMNWWFRHLPVAEGHEEAPTVAYQGKTRSLDAVGTSGRPSDRASGAGVAALAATEADPDRVMLLRPRKSRIYFLRKFFDYPIQLSKDTLVKLGLVRTFKIGISYMRRAAFPIRNVKNLEQFFINRFGSELYKTFFKSYTEKVWGVPCEEIGAEWGEQRIKGLSILKTIAHHIQKMFRGKDTRDISQKNTETSLIEQFLYPKFGPGQMWEVVAQKVIELGGEIVTEFDVTGLQVDGFRIASVTGSDKYNNQKKFTGDYVFSTMPIQELVRSLHVNVPLPVCEVSEGLIYRDFITVGLLCNKLKVRDAGDKYGRLISDNWIYIQEPDVLLGRLQVFNNWSPHLVSDSSKVWLGAEYFCYETDELWSKSDAEMGRFAIEELDKIDILERDDVIDFNVVRVPKTYPAYFGTYDKFEELRKYIDQYDNLFLVGRNGMHKYNNQDHSMLTAMTAVDNIIAGRTDKSNIWSVNTEMDYHEERGKQ